MSPACSIGLRPSHPVRGTWETKKSSPEEAEEVGNDVLVFRQGERRRDQRKRLVHITQIAPDDFIMASEAIAFRHHLLTTPFASTSGLAFGSLPRSAEPRRRAFGKLDQLGPQSPG